MHRAIPRGIVLGLFLLTLSQVVRAAVNLSGLSVSPPAVSQGASASVRYTLTSDAVAISSGTLTVELSQGGSPLYVFNDVIPATGVAQVSGTVTLNTAGVNFGTYDVTFRANGIEDQGGNSVTYNVSGPAGTLTVANVTSSQVDAFLELARTPSQRRVAEVLSNLCVAQRAEPGLQRDCEALIQASTGSAADQAGVQDALAAITPDQASIPVRSSRNGVLAQHRNLGMRLAALRAGARGFDVSGLQARIGDRWLPVGRLLLAHVDQVAASDGEGDALLGALWESSRWGGFLNGTWTDGRRDATPLLRGSDFDGLSLTAGVDYRFTRRLVAGLALGYGRERNDLGGNTGDLDARGFHVSLYGNFLPTDHAYLDFMATWGRRDFDQDRRIRYRVGGTTVDQVASADFDGRQWSLAVGGGMEWSRDGWTHGPLARLEYVRASADGYEERLRDPAAPGSGLGLHVGSQANGSLTSQLGWQVQYAWNRPWGVLLPLARLEWFHEFRSGTGNVLGYFLQDPARETFTLDNEQDDSNYFDLSLGVTAQWTQGRSGYLLVQKILGYGGLRLTSLSAGLRWEF